MWLEYKFSDVMHEIDVEVRVDMHLIQKRNSAQTQHYRMSLEVII